ncbi:MAG: hypothetical protein HY051_04725 [Candidatus Aenigmarchaeota archaeon]|nr:hypothetical protein [Candidatus Aenigmarchaeota archaeon]
MVKIENIYLDTSLLIGVALSLMDSKNDDTRIVKFLGKHKSEITAYTSFLSLAELAKTIKTDRRFRKFWSNDKSIVAFIDTVIKTTNLIIIENEKAIIRKEIIDFVLLHQEVSDCLHVGLAKLNNLWFITHDDKIGKIKPLYENIMTDTKLMKQFDD